MKLLTSVFLLTSCIIAMGQVINYETKISINKAGAKTTKKTLLIQVNSKEENWLSQIQLRHNPRQTFKLEYGSVINYKGEVVRKLKKKDIITRNDFSFETFYQDDLITEFDLYWNQYPYRLEFSYTVVEDEYLYVAYWSPLYYTVVPTLKGSLELSIPPNYVIRTKTTDKLQHRESFFDDKRVLRWEGIDVPLVRSGQEIYQDDIDSKIPRVIAVPSQFNYGINGSSDTWSSFGQWLVNLNADTDILPANEKRKIEKLIQGIEEPSEVVKTIYHYLQDQTKYVDVAIDFGGFKSYPASYVSQNKYGDCKALTTYMQAMLSHVGIESFYSIITAGETIDDIDVNFPSQQFNHVVLMVPLENDTVWLENTANYLPYDYLGTFTQNRHALIIDEENSHLVKTPELETNDVLLERAYDSSSENVNEINVSLTLRGEEFEGFRSLMLNQASDIQNRAIKDFIGIDDLQISKWNIDDFNRDSTFLTINAFGISNSLLRNVGSMKVINPLKITVPDFESPSNRQTEVFMKYPINKSDESVYDLQSFTGSNIQIPEDFDIQSEYGSYSSQFQKKNNLLEVIESFTLFANRIPKDKYKAFYSFIESIKTYKKKTAIIIK